MIELEFVKKLRKRVAEADPLIQVVIGPRQVGKTTGVHQLSSTVPNCNYHSADAIFSEWHTWLERLFQDACRTNSILIIDEVQKIPDWSEKIKQLWDESKLNGHKLRCILLGSSSLELQVGLSESLTGRYELIFVPQWSYSDSKKLVGMTLDEFLIFGGYPGSYKFRHEKQRWTDYLTTSIINNVIMKDILFFRKVRDPALFKQCFDIISHYPSCEISYNKLLGQLQSKGNVEKIKYYLSLFEGAFLLRVLDKYSTKPMKRKISSPKILHSCPALYGRIFGNEILRNSEQKGHAFETIVGNLLCLTFSDVYYWRQKDYEVDFVIEYAGQLLAIEVKSGRRKRESSKNEFMKQFPQAKFHWITWDNFEEFEQSPLQFLQLS